MFLSSWASALQEKARALSETVTAAVSEERARIEAEERKAQLENLREAVAAGRAAAPWAVWEEDKSILEGELEKRVRALAAEQADAIKLHPADPSFAFDLDAAFGFAQEALARDAQLQQLRFGQVPRKLSEHEFWRRYFFQVQRIRAELGVAPLRLPAADAPGGEAKAGAAGREEEEEEEEQHDDLLPDDALRQRLEVSLALTPVKSDAAAPAAAAAAAAAPASAPAEPAAEAAAKEFFKLRTLLLQQCVLSARAHEAFAAQRGEAIAAISDVWSQTERRCAELARRRGELRARRERILAARAAAAACSDGLSARIEAALQRLPSNHASLMHGLRASLFALPCEGVRVDGAELAARLRACGESLAALLRAAASLEQPAAEAAARVEALSEAVDRGAAAATRTAETLRAAAALETLERSLRAHLVQLAESE